MKHRGVERMIYSLKHKMPRIWFEPEQLGALPDIAMMRALPCSAVIYGQRLRICSSYVSSNPSFDIHTGITAFNKSTETLIWEFHHSWVVYLQFIWPKKKCRLHDSFILTASPWKGCCDWTVTVQSQHLSHASFIQRQTHPPLKWTLIGRLPSSASSLPKCRR